MSELATLEVELSEERNPPNPDVRDRRGDAAPQGRDAARPRRLARHGATRSTSARTSSRARSSATATSAASGARARAAASRPPSTAPARRRRASSRLTAAAVAARGAGRAAYAPSRPAATLSRMGLLDRALNIGESEAVPRATRSASRGSTTSSPSSSSRPTRSCASAIDGAARARRGDGRVRSTTCCPRPSRSSARSGKRTMGMRHFDVQLIGGMVLHDGTIAEMRTGEGKTLTATLAGRRSTRWPARASTSSRSTTTSPAATPSG